MGRGERSMTDEQRLSETLRFNLGPSIDDVRCTYGTTSGGALSSFGAVLWAQFWASDGGSLPAAARASFGRLRSNLLEPLHSQRRYSGGDERRTIVASAKAD
jgi:hypothetical protein